MKTIYKEDNLTIEISRTPYPDAVDLVAGIQFGTNGPIFQKKGDKEKVKAVTAPHYMLLKRDEKLVGTCTISQRPVLIGGELVESYYLRHFAVDKSEQGKQYGKFLVNQVKQYFISILPEPYVSYAIIEGANVRSRKVGQFIEYDDVGEIVTQMFSRPYPKKSKNVRQLPYEELDKIQPLLREQYKDYSFFQFEKGSFKGKYFVYEENGEIVAGLHAVYCAWEILRMPGFSGKVIMNVVPYVPIIRRMFNPKHFQFTGFDAFYCKEGCEKQLFRLMKSVMAEYKVSLSLMWFDRRCPLYNRMNKAGRWGLMHRIQGNVPATYVAKVHGVEGLTMEDLRSKPIYAAAFDCV